MVITRGGGVGGREEGETETEIEGVEPGLGGTQAGGLKVLACLQCRDADPE